VVITAAVIGALLGTVIVIALCSITDIPTVLIAAASPGILLYFKKVKEPLIILMGAISGLLLRLFKQLT
jgi:chromate transporter